MKKTLVLVSALTFILLSSAAHAAKVSQVKNKRVLLTLEGEAAAPGNEYFVTNAQGKKVAIIRIKQVKGDKAIADITKGTAQPGYGVIPRTGAGGAGSGSSSTAAAESSDSYYDRKLSQRSRNGNSYGVVGGYLMNSMTASFVAGSNPLTATRVTANMSGTGFGALGYYDYMFAPTIALRGMTGVEQYKVAGSIATADCAGTMLCTVDLTYLSFYGYGRWIFMPGKYKAWLGGGFGYLYAIGKASTVLRQDQISANQIFVLSTGVDIRMNQNTYIPVTLEYGIFPSSDSVKAGIIYLRAGYAWNL